MISLMPNTSLAIKLQPAERTQLEKWGSVNVTAGIGIRSG